MSDREQQMIDYLIEQYGTDYFSTEDIENMCFCDNGSVMVGFVEFYTPFEID